MKNTILTTLTAGLLSAYASLSYGVLIEFTPSDQTVYLGDSVSVDLMISDFADTESLGDWDFDLTFGSGILSLSSVDFGSQLGDSWPDFTNFGGGDLNLNELSFESAFDLESNQNDAFTMATLTFDTIDLGLSELNVAEVWAIGDQNGDWLDYNLASGSIEVIERAVSDVPEPGSIALLALGLMAMGFKNRKMKS